MQSLQLQQQVETSLSFLQVHTLGAGGLAVTAGGTSLCVWDIMAGGRLLQRLSQHQKTVTCVVLSPMAGPDSAAAPRMLSGSLDGHVKVCIPLYRKVAVCSSAACCIQLAGHPCLLRACCAMGMKAGTAADCFSRRWHRGSPRESCDYVTCLVVHTAACPLIIVM